MGSRERERELRWRGKGERKKEWREIDGRERVRGRTNGSNHERKERREVAREWQGKGESV